MSGTNSTVEYRSIKGLPNYRVGNDGSVWSCKKGSWKRLRPSKYPSGRLKAVFNHLGVRYEIAVAVLVLETFVGPRPVDHQACHFPNRDITDNRVCNLMWATPKENKSHEVLQGTRKRGQTHHKARLTEDDVRNMRFLYSTGNYTYSQLAKLFKMSTVQTAIICQRRQWKHI
jgi:hypothetical protein